MEFRVLRATKIVRVPLAVYNWMGKTLLLGSSGDFEYDEREEQFSNIGQSLRYDDLYDEMYDIDIQEALSRLPRSVVDARSARIKRAMDVSMKHVYLDKELQAKQTPYDSYLQDALNLVKLERKERTELGSSLPYNREIP